MKDKKEKTELLEWLKKLMGYARDHKFSMRIIDGIDDCIKEAETRNPDMEKIKAAVEDLLESIDHKTALSTERRAGGEDGIFEDGISIEEIRDQITGIAKRCRSENVELLQNIGERKQEVVKKAYYELQEITHGEAHINELKRSDRYFEFYEQIKSSYEKDAMHVFQEFLNDLSNNYQFVVEHMKSMLLSIGGEKSGFGSRKFYEEHDIKREGILRDMESMAQNSDCGGNDIVEFGNATTKKIRSIVQMSVLKMRFFILLPVLILATGIFFGLAKPEKTQKEVEQQEAAQEAGVWDEVEDQVEDQIVYEIITKIKEQGIVSILGEWLAAVVAVLVFVILLVIVICVKYVMFMKKMCDRWICKSCNTYLQMECSKFRQKDPLLQKMDTVLINLQDEYERQYLDVLNQLFGKTAYDFSDDGNKDQFEILKEEWATIKYR